MIEIGDKVEKKITYRQPVTINGEPAGEVLENGAGYQYSWFVGHVHVCGFGKTPEAAIADGVAGARKDAATLLEGAARLESALGLTPLSVEDVTI